ncbi:MULTISPECIES: DUF6286 domain-containing protein [unclassified Arthrobacter]|uniref:DUF6286 domain-containing protein n=1 Tax=unclassified Arthrobacter TaxID=235627 RepID=UPI0014923132|nr:MULTISPECIES: DUF6286 domain-containing protein [unclassified Arthrobacter]MBE0009636.1 hypothetical protein [Arthrobacter sp. AET 35A]NOJ63389.1 hypothetical protein [Arthrobacter sp. 147(2020)]
MSKKPVSQSLRRRSSRALPATVAALVLLAAAVVAVWGSVGYLTTGRWPAFLSGPSDLAASLTWNAPLIWVASGVALVLGVVLLLASLLPGKHTAIRIGGTQDNNDLSESVISRQGLARLTGALVDQTDGIRSSSVGATARVVKVDAKSTLHDTGSSSTELKAMLTQEFQSMGLTPVPRVRVNVRPSA